MNHPLKLHDAPRPSRLYLAGPMRGYPELNFQAFIKSGSLLEDMGFSVFNPAEEDLETGFNPALDEVQPEGYYVSCDIPAVTDCDLIVMLPGWEKSRLATLEALVASYLGKPAYRFDNGHLIDPGAILAAFSAKFLQAHQPVAAPALPPAPAPSAPQVAPQVTPQVSAEQRAKDATTGGEKCFKPARFEFLPAIPMEIVARVFGYGATKYEDRNWERGYKWSLSYGALQRHLHRFWAGETIDPESGEHHLGHAVFHCLAMMEWHRTHPELDDRPAPSRHQAGTK